MKTHFYYEDILQICDNKHNTVDEIFEKLQKKFLKVGKSSVYRSVKELVDAKKLTKVEGLDRKTYFEKTKEDHIHVIDISTGNIQDVPMQKISLMGLPDGFTVENLDIKVYGTFKKG